MHLNASPYAPFPSYSFLYITCSSMVEFLLDEEKEEEEFF